MVTCTDMPGRRCWLFFCPSSTAMRTGIRWAILTKLPVALSGEMALNSTPVAGEMLWTTPLNFSPLSASTLKVAAWPIRMWRQLGLFHIGDHPVLRRHQRRQVGTGADVGAEPDGNLPQLSVGWRNDPRVLQIDIRQLQRGPGAGNVGLQGVAVDDGGLQILTRHFQRGFRLLNIGGALCGAGPCRIALANRQRAVGGQILHAL
ncbi:Uncharacterised protein [Raoultella terrigena]|uniref:Uncharacterized protein n=1 Tax=Raoultella terrigena TaxID=577 RepID=A0A4U9CS69_RAOTE|nr:Uncharacterised protein [Raoultella terrigena]